MSPFAAVENRVHFLWLWKVEHSHGFGIIAGFYEARVAYYSWRGAPGYTFASIPDY